MNEVLVNWKFERIIFFLWFRSANFEKKIREKLFLEWCGAVISVANDFNSNLMSLRLVFENAPDEVLILRIYKSML